MRIRTFILSATLFLTGSLLFADSTGYKEFDVIYDGTEYTAYMDPLSDVPIKTGKAVSYYGDDYYTGNFIITTPQYSEFESGHFVKVCGTNLGKEYRTLEMFCWSADYYQVISSNQGYFEAVVLLNPEYEAYTFYLNTYDRRGSAHPVAQFTVYYNVEDKNDRPIYIREDAKDDIVFTSPVSYRSDATGTFTVTGTNISDIYTNFGITAVGFGEYVYGDVKMDKKTGYFETTLPLKEKWDYKVLVFGRPAPPDEWYNLIASFYVNNDPDNELPSAFDINDFIFPARTNHTHPWYTNDHFTINGVTYTGFSGATSDQPMDKAHNAEKYVTFDLDLTYQNEADGYIILRGTNYTEGDPHININCYSRDPNDSTRLYGTTETIHIFEPGYFEIPMFFRDGPKNYEFDVIVMYMAASKDFEYIMNFYISNTASTTFDEWNYLFHSSEAPAFDWQIYDTTQNLIAGITDDREKALAVFNFIFKQIEYDYEQVDENAVCIRYGDAISVLNNRLGICADQANLGAAMFRAAGLPCKIADGWLFNGSHAWNEVYYDGKWNSIDVTVGYFEIPQREFGMMYRFESYENF